MPLRMGRWTIKPYINPNRFRVSWTYLTQKLDRIWSTILFCANRFCHSFFWHVTRKIFKMSFSRTYTSKAFVISDFNSSNWANHYFFGAVFQFSKWVAEFPNILELRQIPVICICQFPNRPSPVDLGFQLIVWLGRHFVLTSVILINQI
jgi:hypothetical protein